MQRNPEYSRNDIHHKSIKDFLEKQKEEELKIILYGSEISRLEKEFNNEITIKKGELFRGKLYICTVSRK